MTNASTMIKLALAGLAVIWLLSQFGETPIEGALGAIGIEQPSPGDDGLSPGEYNQQEWWEDRLDEINGCPALDECAGLDPDPLDQSPYT